MDIPVACVPIQNEIDGTNTQIERLQDDLGRAGPGEKASIVRRIKALNARLAVLGNQLAVCMATNPPPPPPPPPLEATFAGVASITTTNADAPGPYTSPVQIGLIFSRASDVVLITSFPELATPPFETPVGLNVTTVSKTGGGNGIFVNRNITMPLTLHFDQSIDLPFIEEDSDLAVLLVTTPPGSAVDANGNVTMTGTGTFSGGFLSGADGTLTIAGTISPVP